MCSIGPCRGCLSSCAVVDVQTRPFCNVKKCLVWGCDQMRPLRNVVSSLYGMLMPSKIPMMRSPRQFFLPSTTTRKNRKEGQRESRRKRRRRRRQTRTRKERNPRRSPPHLRVSQILSPQIPRPMALPLPVLTLGFYINRLYCHSTPPDLC